MRRLSILILMLLCAAVSLRAQSLDAFKQRLAEPVAGTAFFGRAQVTVAEHGDAARAVAEATNVAERFAADPATAGGVTQADNLTVDCQVTDEQTARGTLYHATITVYGDDAQDPVYVLTTARYEQEVG